MKPTLLLISMIAAGFVGTANANETVSTWTCSDSKQFKTTGTTEKVRITWESKTFDLQRENSLPGSLRYKNTT